MVVRADGGVELMRWGFHRKFNPSINNACSDKLDSGTWKEAFHVPLFDPDVAVLRVGLGVGGRKQAHKFCDPDDDCLWTAGMWETAPATPWSPLPPRRGCRRSMTACRYRSGRRRCKSGWPGAAGGISNRSPGH